MKEASLEPGISKKGSNKRGKGKISNKAPPPHDGPPPKAPKRGSEERCGKKTKQYEVQGGQGQTEGKTQRTEG